MPTALFDVNGLVTYPHFAEQIVLPLESAGTPIQFWTYETPVVAYNMLTNAGLRRYTATCLDQGWAEDKRKAFDSMRRREMLGIPLNYSRESLQEYERAGRAWMEAVHKDDGYLLMKYPPLLGDDSYLLVESDNAQPFAGKLFRHKSDIDKLLRTAQETGYSLLLVPEHPAFWSEKRIRPKQDPEMVIGELQKTLLQWKGEHIVRDLGDMCGIYQEGIMRHPERG